LTGETLLLTSSPLPLQPNGKDTTTAASDEEADEKIEVMYGIEYTINRTVQTLSKVKYRFDNCGDVRHPSIIVTTEPVRKAFIDVKNGGIKTRFITEIIKDNLHYCKQLTQVVSEVRHLDGVKGNFAVIDTEYVSYTISEEVRPSSLKQVVRSTSKEFVEQQQHFFDMLWDKAIPAERKIMELESGVMLPERTEIITGADNIARLTIESVPHVMEQLDNCLDSNTPASFIEIPPVWNVFKQLKNRGVKLRFITEITKDNLRYCKEMAKVLELRHLDGIKGNLGIIDGGREYRAYPRIQPGVPPDVLIRSTAKVFVEQQQFFFETLWRKAIPAKQRFKEIEEGAKREFVETVREPSEIQKIGFDLIKAAEEEILILFSTANAFRRQEKTGALELLKEAAILRGVKVRILVPIDNNDKNDAVSERIQQMKDVGIDIRAIKQTFQNKLTTLVVDQSLCLTVELEDDTKETSDEAIGLATYSNSEATVFSYVSIFENLWIQTQLHKRRRQEETTVS
jgi:two-component system, OmpR family, sensor histidine kinase VicK